MPPSRSGGSMPKKTYSGRSGHSAVQKKTSGAVRIMPTKPAPTYSTVRSGKSSTKIMNSKTSNRHNPRSRLGKPTGFVAYPKKIKKK